VGIGHQEVEEGAARRNTSAHEEDDEEKEEEERRAFVRWAKQGLKYLSRSSQTSGQGQL